MNLFKEIDNFDDRKEPFWLLIIRNIIDWNFYCQLRFNYSKRKKYILIKKIRKKAKLINIEEKDIDLNTSACYRVEKVEYKNKIINIYYYNHSGSLPKIEIIDK